MPTRRDLRIMAGLGALALLGAAVVSAGEGPAALLHLAPAVLLLLPLLRGRYVGEERIHALAAPAAPARRLRALARLAPRLPRAPRALVARGGRLLASSLAERGPPVRPACA